MSRNKKTKEILFCALVAAGVLLIGGRNAKADFAFGTPTNLGPTVNSSVWDNVPTVSADGLSLFFDSMRPGGQGGFDIWVTTRETVQDPWGQPVNLGPSINTAADESPGGISPDGLVFYFASNRSSGLGGYDTWVTTRATIQDPWGDPTNLCSTINGSSGDLGGRISSDGLEFYFTSNRPGGSGGFDIWVTTRATIQDPWGNPVNLGSRFNSPVYDYSPAPSPDGLRLFFSSNRPSEYGVWAIWVAERATRDGDWGAPVNLGPAINSSFDQENPCISADGSTLYFASTRPGGSGYVDLWQVSIDPVVDFNGDGIVDAADMCIVVDNWGTDESLCDIGPTPLGDGIVDVEDLKVLAGHLFEEVNDLTLVAHWALDEVEGMFAADSAGDNDGYALGDPVWMPAGGIVDGALQLDGVDDYVLTGFVPDPKEGPFSVLTWIKDGAPGQAVLSQMGGANWLCADASDGNLMTELKDPGGDPLLSNTIITDGEWHRIGLIWDGSNRILYVDGVMVAEDTQEGLESSSNGLYIGTGKAMAPGTYFSGLIDDVRIYNRVVSP